MMFQLMPVQVVCHLLAVFPDQLYSHMLDWIYRLSRTVKVYTILWLEYLANWRFRFDTAKIKPTKIMRMIR